MKTIKDLIKGTSITLESGSPETEITSLVYDSRKVKKGSLYVAVVGANVDGHDFIDQVVEAGAAGVVVEKDVTVPSDVAVLKSSDNREALALLSAAWFDHPADKLKVIGITGTKGKTTTTYMIKSILENAGRKVGLIGTIEAIIGDRHIPASNTTPESYIVQDYLSQMVEIGCDAAVMEVSSQALMLHRVGGMTFEIGIFTNISPDHIGPNEHRDFADYMHCKSLLFQQCRHGIFNADDENLEGILKGHTCTVNTYGIEKPADFEAKDIRLVQEPGYLGVNYKVTGKENFDVTIDVPGRFSVYNSLCAIAVCHFFNVSVEAMQKALKAARVKGRIEMVKVSDDFALMIDYAHNAMALESLLTSIREYHPKRIVTVFGCGGNRSKLRRFEMGEVSGRLSDFTIITSDNPRFEEPAAIMKDIETGIKKTDGKYIMIEDRKEAIKYAIDNGQKGDVIILAGKGHEDYQEIRGKKYPMDERVLIADILAGR
ncbi:MAG: UDP-N-acetylmuramoyl-L-alanyl-D-glutamate--2,6-diaminopimelate ligase [Lachnospiraceae bacterium]|uniref:UDP-N-acetylmuramoyl-L-alanyl-D-glutamate--2,6-diaminopimelate ligase n=1 Tax=Candidatus Weimeria bifida TaxID=2599074 RepID=A0A6N7J2X6_9FIRM|nr:UDP-N-acetylmuramoyl-L-alanyl-D-glutamate--2,6-diaminopimelate ligase [Candidatus Weimeria bifida]RRF96193.1 MAG: UDP-N-acetylmuramoyl-L-alanyl-D-glutamate--2,6-diaminopimelate ligase [Lachnospiraceae bacterium]